METHTNQLTEQSDRSFDNEEGFALYVHLHPTYFGLVVYDENQHKIHQIKTFLNPDAHPGELINTSIIEREILSTWMEENKIIFHRPYDKIRICVSTPLFHLVHDERMATESNFSLMNRYEAGEIEILTDRIRDDLFIQFGLDKNLFSLLSSHFESGNIHFGDRGLLQLLSVESELIKDGVYCQLLGSDTTVAIISGSRLIFFNKYSVKNREDLLYYILLCFQSHELDPGNDQLFLTGLIEKESPMFELIFDYVRNVSFLKPPGEIQLPDDRPEDFSIHYYINLLSIR